MWNTPNHTLHAACASRVPQPKQASWVCLDMMGPEKLSASLCCFIVFLVSRQQIPNTGKPRNWKTVTLEHHPAAAITCHFQRLGLLLAASGKSKKQVSYARKPSLSEGIDFAGLVSKGNRGKSICLFVLFFLVF